MATGPLIANMKPPDLDTANTSWHQVPPRCLVDSKHRDDDANNALLREKAENNNQFIFI